MNWLIDFYWKALWQNAEELMCCMLTNKEPLMKTLKIFSIDEINKTKETEEHKDKINHRSRVVFFPVKQIPNRMWKMDIKLLASWKSFKVEKWKSSSNVCSPYIDPAKLQLNLNENNWNVLNMPSLLPIHHYSRWAPVAIPPIYLFVEELD